MLDFIVINENHSLLPDQERLLDEHNVKRNFVKIPTTGLTYEEMFDLCVDILNQADEEQPSANLDGETFLWPKARVVFISPVPAMIVILARTEGRNPNTLNVRVMHNDKRVAKEVPDGKGGVRLIHTVASDGWQLV